MATATSNISSTFFLIAILVYIALLTFISWVGTRGKAEGKNFISGGNGIGVMVLLGTMASTCIGAGSSVGATSNGWLYGWAGSLVGLGNGIGMWMMMTVCYTFKYGFTTLPEQLQFFYNGEKKVRVFFTILAIASEIVMVGNTINGGATFLSFVTDLTPFQSKLLMSAGFCAYAIFGGYLGVVLTDAIQSCIILFGFFGIMIRALSLAGGFSGIEAVYVAADNSGALSFFGYESYGAMAAVSLVIASIFNVFGANVIHQRVYNSKSEKESKKLFFMSGIMIALFGIAPSVLGMCARTIAANSGVTLEAADQAFVYLASVALPPTFGFIFLVAGLAAILSPGNLMSGIAMIFNDFWPMMTKKPIEDEEYKKYGRIAIVSAMVVSFALALYANNVITYIVNVAGMLLPVLGIVLLAGRFWKRATADAAIISSVFGMLVGIANLFIPSFASWVTMTFGTVVIPVCIVTGVLLVVISLCTKRVERSEAEILAMVREFTQSGHVNS